MNGTVNEERVAHIEQELAVITASQERTEGMRKFLWSIGLFLVVQALGIAVGYGELKSQLSDIGSFRSDTSAVLTVLADHGTELLQLRQEIATTRGRNDSMSDDMMELRATMEARTHDRFYRSDWTREEAKMREWVELKIENNLFSGGQ